MASEVEEEGEEGMLSSGGWAVYSDIEEVRKPIFIAALLISLSWKSLWHG